MPANSLLIRRARVEDAASILELYRDGSLDPAMSDARADDPAYADAIRKLSRGDDNQLLVGELDGRVVGTFLLTFVPGFTRRGALVAQVEAVWVEAGLRGQRIGQQMMEWAIREARERGAYRLQLTSNKSRTRAHRFYERLGFHATHEGMKLPLD